MQRKRTRGGRSASLTAASGAGRARLVRLARASDASVFIHGPAVRSILYALRNANPDLPRPCSCRPRRRPLRRAPVPCGPCRRRHVAPERASRRRAEGEARLRGVARAPRAPAEVLRALLDRRVRVDRQPGRPRDDQPPRGQRHARQALHPRAGPPRHRVPGEGPWRGAALPGPGAERAVVDRGRDRPRGRRRQGGEGHRRRGRGAPARDHSHRGREREGHRPQERGGHALAGRPLPPLPLPHVARRTARVRARDRDRLLRRGCRQLRVPAVRPRLLLLPHLRGRQAAEARALPGMGRRRREGGRARLHLGPPGIDQPPLHRRPRGLHARRRGADGPASAVAQRGEARHLHGPRRRGGAHRARGLLRHAERPQVLAGPA